MIFVFLDSGPLGLLANPCGRKSTYLKHGLPLGAMGTSPYERFLPIERQGTVAQCVAVRNWGSRIRNLDFLIPRRIDVTLG